MNIYILSRQAYLQGKHDFNILCSTLVLKIKYWKIEEVESEISLLAKNRHKIEGTPNLLNPKWSFSSGWDLLYLKIRGKKKNCWQILKQI